MMETNSAEPDWSKLPFDPAAFFGLAGGFTRDDLKRRYSRLLKQFKPDRHPEQFRMIRSAYEELLEELEYDPVQGGTIDLSDLREVLSKRTFEENKNSVQPHHPVAPRRPWHERVRLEPLGQLIDELRRLPHKTAFDFYLLAILTDAAPLRDNMTFLHGLLDGLEKYPDDVGLRNTLRQLFREPVLGQDLPGLLLAVAKRVSDGRFYRLTEPLWHQLLSTASFGVFSAALKACESHLKDCENYGKTAFWLKLIKRAVWKAEQWWLTEAIQRLEADDDSGTRHFDLGLEIVKSLQAYAKSRADFLDGDPVRRDLDRVFQDYCMLEEAAAEQSFVTFQIRVASGNYDLAATLTHADENCGAAFLAWDWISVDMSERLGKTARELPAIQLRRLILATKERLQLRLSQSRASLEGRLGFLQKLKVRSGTLINFSLIAGGLAILAIQVVGTSIASEYWFQVATFACVLAGIAAYQIDLAWINPKVESIDQKFVERRYEMIFRKELQLIVREWFLGHRDLKAILQALVETPSLEAIGQIAQRDLSLRVVANAMTFLP